MKKPFDESDVIEAARVFSDPASPYYEPEIADTLFQNHPHWFRIEEEKVVH